MLLKGAPVVNLTRENKFQSRGIRIRRFSLKKKYTGWSLRNGDRFVSVSTFSFLRSLRILVKPTWQLSLPCDSDNYLITQNGDDVLKDMYHCRKRCIILFHPENVPWKTTIAISGNFGASLFYIQICCYTTSIHIQTDTQIRFIWISLDHKEISIWISFQHTLTMCLLAIPKSRLYSKSTWESKLAFPWWRHQMETCSALLDLCVGNSSVTGEFPTQRPVTRSFDDFFDLRLNERLSKQSPGWWIETPMRSLWHHGDVK